MIFRIDDVSVNTDILVLRGLTEAIWSRVPGAVIMMAISPLVHDVSNEPAGDRERAFPRKMSAMSDHRNLFRVGKLGVPSVTGPNVILASHGLVHVDHRLMGREAQELSIVTSCALMGTRVFVPPFNKYDADTIDVCEEHKIELVRFEDDWRHVKFNTFDSQHDKFYLHTHDTSVDFMRKWLNLMIVSVHQPNYFMHGGGLSKIRRSDIHIVMTRAQFARGNYQNRFIHDGAWYTMSVNQKLEPLVAKRYSNSTEDWAKIKRRLPEYAGILSDFDADIGESLVETNIAILRRICARLDIHTKIVMDFPTLLTKSERLFDLCRFYGATEYLSGPSGRDYLDVKLFEQTGIKVSFQDKEPSVSAIDLLQERSRARLAG